MHNNKYNMKNLKQLLCECSVLTNDDFVVFIFLTRTVKRNVHAILHNLIARPLLPPH